MGDTLRDTAGRHAAHWARPVMSVLLGAAMLLGTAACDGEDAPPSDQVPGTVAPSTTIPVRKAAAAADGGKLRVLEQGFTTGNNGLPMVSYGAVVENTSNEQAALLTRVGVKLSDAAGRAIASSLYRSRKISVILPGQRLDVGGTTYVKRGGATKLKLEVGVSIWVAPNFELRSGFNGPAEFLSIPGLAGTRIARFTAGDIESDHDDDRPVKLDFAVHSGYSVPLGQVWAQAVFRDKAGKIVGGISDVVHDVAPGDSVASIRHVLYGGAIAARGSRAAVSLFPYALEGG